MTKLKVLSVAAALTLVLPIATSSAGFAQEGPKFRGGGAHIGGGGGFRGGPVGGGGFRAGPVGGGFRAGPVVSAPAARFNAPVIAGSKFAGGPVYAGGGPRHIGGGPRHRHGGFWPGLAAGAVIGGALAAGSYYSPYYYNSYGYYDDGYYDDSAVAVVPEDGDATAYCMQRFKSYDPASGTYLGYDGLRHPCP